jgi:outer membrane protein assembly factor BamD (BamD/ComL family)
MAYPELAKQENLEDVIQRIDKSFARKILDVAHFYRRTHDPSSAAYQYRFLIQSWPNTPEAEQARRELAELPASALQNPPPPPSGGEYAPTTQPVTQ